MNNSLAKLSSGIVITVSASEEILFLEIHSTLLSLGFTCIYEVPSSVPGFAPTIKENAASRLVFDGWNADLTALTASYKLRSVPTKIFVLTLLQMGSNVVVITLADKVSGTAATANIDLSDHVDNTLLSANIPIMLSAKSESRELVARLILQPESLKAQVESLLRELGITLPTSSSSSTKPPANSDRYSVLPAETAGVPSTVYTPPSLTTGSVPLVGDGDLHPFPQSPGVSPYIPALVPPSTGSGSLVGPDHPIFHNDPLRIGPVPGTAPLPYIPGLPEPRYDPVYPYIPGQLPAGDYNPFGMGRGGGRGRGGRRGPLGDPNPDHLRPPGFEDEPFDRNLSGGSGRYF